MAERVIGYHGTLESTNALYGGEGMPPLVINCCLTGIVPTKSVNPHVPVSVEEIVEDACRVAEAGASMLHVHARDAGGVHTWRPEPYARIFSAIRRHHPDVILVATTSGRSVPSLECRAAVLELEGEARPDMASLTLGSLNFPRTASCNDPETIQGLARCMVERGIRPELEVFEPGMLNYAFYLLRKGLLRAPCYVNFLLGSLGAMAGRVADLAHLVRDVPADWTWAAAGIGRYQLPINTAAIVMGGHVRVGLEDNLFLDAGKREPASNVALVERVVRISGELERPIATPAQARRLIGLADGGHGS
ncbi:MAG: 3-keto-5-aminohexanoate cleavage protein [Gammaproteobacteria bacterium]|nr:3-keto-5-aminohexanoate cleavage protein [Gammaproteobacteria bacterium]